MIREGSILAIKQDWRHYKKGDEAQVVLIQVIDSTVYVVFFDGQRLRNPMQKVEEMFDVVKY